MLYCERCHTAYEDACPLCEKHDGRPIQEDDLTFVTEQSDLWAGILEDVFQQAGIPLVRRQMVGVAPYLGTNVARYRLYTPFRNYEAAMDLYAETMEPAEDLENTDGDLSEPDQE